MPVLLGPMWRPTGDTTTLTWSFATDNYPILREQNPGYKDFETPIDASYRATIRVAFTVWAAVANVVLVEVADGPTVDIRIGNILIDGRLPGGSAGAAATGFFSGAFYRTVEIYLDVDAADENRLYQTAVHEIGHALGLGHSPIESAVMYFRGNILNVSGQLTDDDIAGIQQLYGARDPASPQGSTAILIAGSNILRLTTSAMVNDYAVLVRAGAMTDASAIAEIVRTAAATTSVATLSYEFFTGRVPGAAGMDYLVAPDGPNPNNLNSAYYQSFNLENRYINFAVNLGKAGEGAAAFNARYGDLSLFEATRQAYSTIFGSTPSDAKLHAILDPVFELGGLTLSRTEYFSLYGGDDSSGIGTKAAMVGYLLAEAVKADVGVYARSNDAFLADLADGEAFAVDIVGAYNRPEYIFFSG